MHLSASTTRLPQGRFDLTLAFVIVTLVFVCISVAQFSRGWSDAQRGLLLYEQTCPLNGGPDTKR
jgi:hypothetical protein